MSARMNQLVLSLFPGGDLFGLAFEREGYCVVTGPDVIFGRDIRAFNPPLDRFDGVIGGPPCQPFSPLVHLVRANGREPKHGNLIPEFERVVYEARPSWFVMEESPFAPVPNVPGYAVTDFVLDNSTLDRGDGFGEAQMRKRRFSFGWLGRFGTPPDLRRWMEFCVLELSSPSLAVTSGAREVPVAVGGSGNVKHTAVIADYDHGRRPAEKQRTVRSKNDSNAQPWERQQIEKARAVVAQEAAGGISDEKLAWQQAHRKSGLAPWNYRKRSWSECCVLQGLPPDWLSESPFTQAGKFTVLGNGVPLSMGRAIARAVTQAMAFQNGEVEVSEERLVGGERA